MGNSKNSSQMPGYQKTVLITASVASMIDQFNWPNIRLLLSLGYDVDVAANFMHGSTCTDERIAKLIKQLDQLSIDCYQIDFDRKAVDVKADLRAFRQLDAVVCGTARPVNPIRHHNMRSKNYAFIHSHSPIGGAAGRITAARHRIKSIYTAHGFHFYRGAPLRNWIIFYFIEWMLSWMTDVLITINQEDYARAKKYFHAKKTVYIPGVGVDVKKYQNLAVNREEKRKALGIRAEDIFLLSVGELNQNKNHKTVIEALGKIEPELSGRLHYVIAGKGGLKKELGNLADQLGVRLHLLGFCSDVPELLKAADIFLLPSFREGLNVGLMEAMAAGLPAIVSDIRGNRDLIRKQDLQVKPEQPDGWAQAVRELAGSQQERMAQGVRNQKVIRHFRTSRVMRMMRKLYL